LIGADLAFGTSVVHRDIETAEPCDVLRRGCGRHLLPDIGLDELRLRTERVQFSTGARPALVTPTGNDDLRALLGKGEGGAPFLIPVRLRDKTTGLCMASPGFS